MLIKRIYDRDLAQASYLIGCQAHGSAVVVDPHREVDEYIRAAARHDLRITHVTETHIHADYLSGARELSSRTGAELHLSAEGGPDWLYRFSHQPLRHGDVIMVGNLSLKALHTPGHTPEHLSFLLTDHAAGEEPARLLSGDFMFVGDLGRPDLLDAAAGGHDTRFGMGAQLFDSLKQVVRQLPAWLQVLPGHGAGSACGKALGAVDSTTLGYELATAWWRDYVHNDDQEGFVRELLTGQPDAPLYFGRMKRSNRQGAPLLGERPELPELNSSELQQALARGAVLVDTRSRDDWLSGAAAGSLHVPAGEHFVSWAAWVLDPEQDDRDLILLAPDSVAATRLRDRLSRIGVDRVSGFSSSTAGLPAAAPELLPLSDRDRLDGARIVDVREGSEFGSQHLPGALNVPAGQVLWQLNRLPQEQPLVVHCQSGARSAVIASALRRHGFSEVLELEGNLDAWLPPGSAQAGGTDVVSS